MKMHTPGPWIVHPLNAMVVPEAALDVPIAKLLWPTDERSEDETFANARLIAAAPALLSALTNVTHALSYCMNNFVPSSDLLRVKCQKNLDTARAAIAQAAPTPAEG